MALVELDLSKELEGFDGKPIGMKLGTAILNSLIESKEPDYAERLKIIKVIHDIIEFMKHDVISEFTEFTMNIIEKSTNEFLIVKYLFPVMEEIKAAKEAAAVAPVISGTE